MNEKRPNILWIFSDQHRAQAISCYGDKNVETPNLDKLASEGIRFDNAYCNTPICSPSRATLYTGKYINSHGVISLFVPPYQGQRMLADELRDVGYYTSHMGKWHLSGGDCPCHFVSPYFRPGWDEWLGWENSNRPWDTEYSVGSMPFPLSKLKGYQTDAITDFTVDWIENNKAQTPWFHVVSIEPPHPPNTAPEKYMAKFRDKIIDLRPNVPKSSPGIDFYINKLRCYYAQIENLDYNVGRMIDALDQTGQLDNTIIFYFSDHGDMMGSHGRMHKSRPELESSKIPLIIRYPKLIPTGQVCHGLFSVVDIMPSLLGILDIEIPDYVQGMDFSDLICGRSTKGREAVILQFERNFYGDIDPKLVFRTIVTGDWMYSCFLTTGLSQLFNLNQDPYQMNNLVDERRFHSTKQGLHRKLIAELENINDDFLSRYKETVI